MNKQTSQVDLLLRRFAFSAVHKTEKGAIWYIRGIVMKSESPIKNSTPV